jgi:hypothetical protein
VHNRIECALQECGVDGAYRAVALGSHAGGKYHRMLFSDTHIEITLGKMRPEQIKPGAVGHGRRNGHDAVILACQIHKRIGKGLCVGWHAGRFGLPCLRIIRPQTVELLLTVQRWLVAASLLGKNVKDYRPVFSLEELEGLNQQGQVVAVDGAVVLQAKLLEEDGGPEHALGSFFGTARQGDGGFAAKPLHDATSRIVQILVVLIGHDSVEVASDGPHIPVN